MEIKCKAKCFLSYCGCCRSLLFTKSMSDNKTNIWTIYLVAKILWNQGYSSDLWDITPFWGKKLPFLGLKMVLKEPGTARRTGSFLDTLGMDLINIIIHCKWKEIKISPQSTGIILFGESHYGASVWIAHYSAVRCLFIILWPLLKVTRYELESFKMFHIKRIKRKKDKVGLFLTLKKFPRFWNDILYSNYSTVWLKTNECRWHNFSQLWALFLYIVVGMPHRLSLFL